MPGNVRRHPPGARRGRRSARWALLVLALGLSNLVATAQDEAVSMRLPAKFDECYPLEVTDRTTDRALPKEQLKCDFKAPVAEQILRVRQGREPELTIQIRSGVGAPKYSLATVDQRRYEAERDYIRLLGGVDESVREFRDDVTFQSVREYNIRLRIDGDTPPRDYDLVLGFNANGQIPQKRAVRLYVGSADNERYVVARAVSQPMPPTIVAGQSSPLELLVENRFPTYDLTLQQIKVVSSPPGLIDELIWPASESVADVQLTQIASGQPTQVDLTVQGRTSLTWLLTPVNPKPSLKLTLTYDDGFRSGVRRLPDIPIEFHLDFDAFTTWVFALISVVIGSVLGSSLRLWTDKKPRKKVTLANGWGHFAGQLLALVPQLLVSVLLSSVFVILALIGRVEVIAGGVPVPLHKPVMTMLMSLIVSLFDPEELVQRLRQWFPLAKASPAQPSQ